MADAIKFVSLPNQVRIPYLEQGDKAGVPLILLHGLADSLHTFKLLMPLLPDWIHTFAYTQRGHSDSSSMDIGYRTKDFASDLLMFMDALHIEKAVITGASSGGFTARRFAIDHPERTLGLVLLGSPSTLQNNPKVKKTQDSTISRLNDPVDPMFIRGFINSTISKPIPQEFFEMILKEHQKITAMVWRETSGGLLEESFPGELDKISIPTLIIWGDQDAILPRYDQEALRNVIKGSRLVVYPGIGHSLYWEAPDLIASDLVSFIKDFAN